ncbi:macrophage mannose receptor 1-like isoform X1 [Huso huso]|uniref:Macrophage mannose receptor 1-like isoform X1 n=1 Tax=Huso huso TaxID=61971 RepID=A0ABR0Y1U3_HUSHU
MKHFSFHFPLESSEPVFYDRRQTESLINVLVSKHFVSSVHPLPSQPLTGPIYLFSGICEVAASHFRKYHFVKDEKSWFDAQSYCRENHTDLATIESQEETEKVLNISAGLINAWIGLYYDKENWQWSNGDNVSYYNWKSSLSCISVDSNGEWVDSDCHSNRYSFICYNETSERYILIEQLKTWYEALQYCREHHTDLVSVKNEDENKEIKEKANGNPVWIGLFNNPWKWSDGGDNYTPQNWSENQPDNHEGKEKSSLSQAQYTFFSGICAVASGHFRKYHFVKDKKSWFDAQSYCREKHTDLATIESQEETEKVLNILAGFTDAWIGLYYDKENWQWSNGDNVSYYNWTSSLSCTSVNSKGVWVDSDCHSNRSSFICYNGKVTFSFSFLFMLS